MEAVINPWWFYWLGVADGIPVLCIVAISVCMFISIISAAERRYDITIRCVVVAIVTALIMLFTPSSDTLIKMAVAQNVTADRVAVAQDVAVKVYNDTIGLIKENK